MDVGLGSLHVTTGGHVEVVGAGGEESIFMGIYFIRMPIKVPCLFEKNITCPIATFNFSLRHFSININRLKEKHVVSNIFL